jgi:hypothetical protein
VNQHRSRGHLRSAIGWSHGDLAVVIDFSKRKGGTVLFRPVKLELID